MVTISCNIWINIYFLNFLDVKLLRILTSFGESSFGHRKHIFNK